MKSAFAFLLRIYAGLTALGTALLAVAGAALFASGALTGERVGETVRVLREGPAPPVVRERTGEEQRREAARRAAEETIVRRHEELRRIETRVSARVLLLEADRARFEEERRRHAEAEAQLRAERESPGPSGSEEAVSTNVALFSRMEGAEVAEAMKDWDDARLVRTLRALRPSKAAEVLSAFRTDPRFEAGFRRPPSGAPRGARTRLERIFEAMQEGR